MPNEKFLVPVDQYGNWQDTYREVTKEELDKFINKYAQKILDIIETGAQGAMVMWACFKSRLCSGCYHDMINAYRLLSGDGTDLVKREHELRHTWEQYEELWAIRYYGSLEKYYLEQAESAKKEYEFRVNKGEKKDAR